MFMRPPLIASYFFQDDYKDKRLEFFCENILPKYDIISLQEAFCTGSSRVEKLLDYAKTLGFHAAIVQNHRNIFIRFGIDGGIVFLSKFPIICHDWLEYERGTYSDYFTAKGAMYVKLDMNSQSNESSISQDSLVLNIFSTHLQASYEFNLEPDGYRAADCGVEIRRSQIRQLGQFIIDKLGGSNPLEPILIMGDFNIISTPGVNGEYEYLTRYLSDIVSQLGHESLIDLNPTHEPTFVGQANIMCTEEQEKECFDYIFISFPSNSSFSYDYAKIVDGAIPSIDQSVCRVSDHYGLSFDMKLKI